MEVARPQISISAKLSLILTTMAKMNQVAQTTVATTFSEGVIRASRRGMLRVPLQRKIRAARMRLFPL
jgi:hypothetical protein